MEERGNNHGDNREEDEVDEGGEDNVQKMYDDEVDDGREDAREEDVV